MSDSANKLPALTDEQRRANLEKATAVRKERKALLDLVRQVPSPSSRLLLTPNTGAFLWFAC